MEVQQNSPKERGRSWGSGSPGSAPTPPAKGFATVTGLLVGDVMWHPTTASPGSRRGAAAIGEMFGGRMALTEGTFALKPTMEPMVNGSLAAAHVYFNGVDLLRIEGARSQSSSRRSAGQRERGRILGQCLGCKSVET
jgi:hypothetical protein